MDGPRAVGGADAVVALVVGDAAALSAPPRAASRGSRGAAASGRRRRARRPGAAGRSGVVRRPRGCARPGRGTGSPRTQRPSVATQERRQRDLDRIAVAGQGEQPVGAADQRTRVAVPVGREQRHRRGERVALPGDVRDDRLARTRAARRRGGRRRPRRGPPGSRRPGPPRRTWRRPVSSARVPVALPECSTSPLVSLHSGRRTPTDAGTRNPALPCWSRSANGAESLASPSPG